MATYLVATATVHETAAVCDYLEERAGPDDLVVGFAAVPGDDPAAARDAEEALNVLPVRLPALGVEADRREGDAAGAVLAAAADHGADEVVVAAGYAELDGLLTDADRPVVVVPDPAGDA